MKYEFNIEHNTIFTIKILKRWVNNNSMCKLCICVIVHVLSTIVINPFFIFRLPWYIKYWWTAWSEVYPVFQDLCTPVWGKDNCFIVLLIDANYATFYFTLL